ncbi:ATP-binding protein [Aeribacillus pallidus]|uniref:ATP-binding protein n=1 Tax=Aeribacillus pallidus TaxID=33936 RepID=UPI003D1D65FB
MADLQKKASQFRITNQENGTTTTSHSTTSYKCEKCQDLGLIFVDNNTARICECAAQRKIERLFKSSEITEEFKKLNFTNFKREGRPQVVQEAFKCAVAYFKSFPNIRSQRRNSIALLGNPGAGKTHLLTAVANNLIKNQIEVLYFPYREGFDEIKDDLETLEQKCERMKSVEVLFIDDLFKRGATDFEVKTMYSVINYRYLNHKPIMVSSEYLEDDLLDVDEALGSRIIEMCRDFLVEIQGDRKLLNYRLAK